MAGPTMSGATATIGSVTNTGDTTVTSAFTPAVGEILVAKIGTSSVTYPTAAVDSNGTTWTLRAGTVTTGNAQESPTSIWTATATVAASTTLTATFNSNAALHSTYIVIERYANAVLASTPASNHIYTQAALSSTITTVANTSVVTWVSTDWNVLTGTPTYLSSATQSAAPNRTSSIAAYTAYQNAATAGSQTYGFSAPTGQWPSLTAIEIRVAPPSSLPQPVININQVAVTRAAAY